MADTRIAVFVDGGNFFYMQKALGWFADPKKLLDLIAEQGKITDAYYYLGQDMSGESKQQGFMDALPNMGYTVVPKPIKTILDTETGEGRRKANLDVEIVLDMFNTIDSYDMAVLVSGDGDFERPLNLLRSRGKRFQVYAVDHLIARELRQVAGRHYIRLSDLRDRIEKLR